MSEWLMYRAAVLILTIFEKAEAAGRLNPGAGTRGERTWN